MPDKSEIVEVYGSERKATLAELSAEITEQATDALGFRLAEERDTELDKMPARILTFVGEERGKTYRQYFVLAVASRSAALADSYSYLEIKYLTNEGADASRAKLEQMIRSARRVPDSPPPPETPEGYTRRFAGALTLDVPANLRGGGYQFTLREDGAIITDDSVVFEIYEADGSKNEPDKKESDETAPTDTAQTTEGEIADDENADTQYGGQISERTTNNFSNDELSGTIVGYAINNDPPWEKQPRYKLTRRASLRLNNGAQVRVVARGGATRREMLEQIFNQIISSVRSR